MRVSLAKNFSNGGYGEPELTISCNQTRLPVEGFGNQPSHKPLYLQFVLLTRFTGVKVAQKLLEWPTVTGPA